MEFGKLQNVDDVNWALPQEDLKSLDFLQSRPQNRTHQFYVGAPAWGANEWVGLIYPPQTKSNEYLSYYAKSYNCIELNTTHYRIPSAEQAQKWCAQVGEGFLFCPKIPQDISHRKNGLADQQSLRLWLEFLQSLGTHSGPGFLQLPPNFDYSYKQILFHFLKQWPIDFELSLEFRHPSWFQNNQILPALADYLRTRNIGLVITDVAGRRDVLHTTISADFTMIRFIGNNLHPSDYSRMVDWAARLQTWCDSGLQRVFFFIHEPEDIQTPQMTQFAIKNLVEITGADLQPLHFYNLGFSE